MSNAQRSLSKTDPRMIAWEDYKQSDAYANSFKWAERPEHRDGSMWASFLQGYEAALASPGDDGWRDIASAPKDGTSILACDARAQDWFLVVAWDDDTKNGDFGWKTSDGLGYHDLSLTHWRPLPPPSVEDGERK